MTVSLFAVPVTESGIACAKCSYWENHRKVVVHHATVADVRRCHLSTTPLSGDVINAAWAASKNTYAEREAEQERAAYQAKMERDDALSLTQHVAQRQQQSANPWPSNREAVVAGRYAVMHDGTLKFYKVDKPTEGRWAGYTFVAVQASDDMYPVRNRQAREEILNLIAVDPQAAMLRYGMEIGQCGHCGRTLTNEESRQYGIGPVCRSKMGW